MSQSYLEMSIDSLRSEIVSPIESSLELSEISINTQDLSSTSTTDWTNEHFNKIMIENKEMRECLFEGCGKRYSAGSSTITFKNHWKRLHSESYEGNMKKTRFMFHDDLHVNRLIKMVICGHLCYSLVDLPEFRKFVESLNPNKRVICRQTLAVAIIRSKTHLTNLVSVKLADASSVALTFDIWSAHKGARGFGCVTAHYISSANRLENLILHFKRMKFPHDAATIRKFIEKPIKVFNLKGRIVAITTDNASNNLAAIRCFDESYGLTSVNLGFVHYRCVAHIFDLGMKDAMKHLIEVVRPVRVAVMAIRSSRKRKEAFEEKQKELIRSQEQDTRVAMELAEDVDHRWNSLFVLLERAFLLRKAIDFMIESIKGLELISDVDWTTIEEVIKFLKPFDEATKRLCSASDVTISSVSYITPKLINHCSAYETSENEWIISAARSLSSKLTDYSLDLYQPIVDLAYYLDPRYKTKDLSDEHCKMIKDRLCQLLEQTPVEEPQDTTRSSILGYDSDTEESVDELSAYSESRRVKMSTDVLLWWKVNQETYPKMSELARKILPVQATSVASERVFSVAGYVDTKIRNRLSDESVENIILFKSWMQYLNIE